MARKIGFRGLNVRIENYPSVRILYNPGYRSAPPPERRPSVLEGVLENLPHAKSVVHTFPGCACMLRGRMIALFHQVVVPFPDKHGLDLTSKARPHGSDAGIFVYGKRRGPLERVFARERVVVGSRPHLPTIQTDEPGERRILPLNAPMRGLGFLFLGIMTQYEGFVTKREALQIVKNGRPGMETLI
jgi:hypothetical protein